MTIKLYWWRGEGATNNSKQNFGDYLSPLIVEMISGKKVEYADPRHADILAIGSILSKERKAKGLILKRQLHIWGTGTDKPTREFCNRHIYHAVRGKKTVHQIKNCNQDPALGDPGLLVDRWWGSKQKPAKRYRLGIIPHFIDQQDSRVKDISMLDRTKVIDVFAPVTNVVQDILQCDFILSSSMHGLIIADAFGIPNRRLVLSSGIISDLKFDDYYSAFNIDTPTPIQPSSIIETGWLHPVFHEKYERPGLENLKNGLANAFPNL